MQDAVQVLIGLNTSVNERFLHFQQSIMQLDQKVHIPECVFVCHFVPNFESINQRPDLRYLAVPSHCPKLLDIVVSFTLS